MSIDKKEDIAGYMLGNMDIEFYCSNKDLEKLRETKNPVVLYLDNVHGDFSKRKATIQYDSIASSECDGIAVDIVSDNDDFSYKIRISDRFIENVLNSGIFGSRYGNGEKVSFSTGEDIWKRAKEMQRRFKSQEQDK